MRKINNFIITSVLFIDLFLVLKDIIAFNFKNIIDYGCLFLVFLFPLLLNKIPRLRMTDKEVFLYLVFVFVADFLGSVFNFYDSIEWFDTLTHFIFGICSGGLGIYLLTKLKLYNQSRYYVMAFMFIIITLGIASLWEIYEFSADTFFNTNMQSLETGVVDTMQDLITALLGIFLFCIGYIGFKIKHRP